ncbi:MAG: hypothetical protein WC284_19090 [Candidimonas sp.]
MKYYFIDFEASALHKLSYPIEVGIACLDMEDLSITSKSWLIRPTKLWIDQWVWMPESAAIHNIPFETLLKNGHEPLEVVEQINEFVDSKTVYSDAHRYDGDWHMKLIDAANVEASFIVDDMFTLLVNYNREISFRVIRWIDEQPTIHRAEPDAIKLAESIQIAERLKNDL